MAQRYSSPIAKKYMAQGLCPECGNTPESHVQVGMFQVQGCGFGGLTRAGVEERIAQFRADISEGRS